MTSLPPIGVEGKARGDTAQNLLRVHRVDFIRECTAAALCVGHDRDEVYADYVRAITAAEGGA